MTNSSYEIQGGLTPAEAQVRSAFETTFHPLTQLEELESLRAYTGDYGSKAVLRAIEKASGSVKESIKRRNLSPRYLLSILQGGERARSAQEPQKHDPLKSCMAWAEPFIE